jgi:hypothetical protein
VTGVSGPNGVRPGETINIRVTAFGARRVSSIDLSARGGITSDTTVVLSPAVVNAMEIITLRLPDNVQDTLITLTATANDQFGFSSAPRSGLVTFAIDTPSVQLLVPPTVEAGKVLNLAVLASALRHVTEIRLEYRGGFIADEIITIAPTRARTLEYISKLLPSDLMVPEVRVRAFVLDRANTISATAVHTVATPSGGPIISSASIHTPTVFGGHYVDVRVQATGQRPIKRLRFRWRGFIADLVDAMRNDGGQYLVGPDQNVGFSTSSTSIVEDVGVSTPCVQTDAVFMMLITAYDEDGQVSPIVTQFVNVSGNSECGSISTDTTGGSPRVRGRLPSGITKDGRVSLGETVPSIMAGRAQALDFADMVAMAAGRKSNRRGRSRRIA